MFSSFKLPENVIIFFSHFSMMYWMFLFCSPFFIILLGSSTVRFQLFQNTFVITLQSEKQTCALYSHVLIIGFRVIDYVDMAQTRGVLWNTNNEQLLHKQNCGHQ